VRPQPMLDLARRRARLLVPRMGTEAEAVAAAMRGVGVRAETLPTPTPDTLRLGRRHTSGKECLPMTVTLGSLLERVSRACGKPESPTSGSSVSYSLHVSIPEASSRSRPSPRSNPDETSGGSPASWKLRETRRRVYRSGRNPPDPVKRSPRRDDRYSVTPLNST